MEKQRTIEKETSIEGVGLRTGQKVKLTFKPALDNHGIVFQRVDLEGQPKVQAIADNVTEVERGTTIEKKEAKVQADQTKKAVKAVQAKVEKSTLGDLGALADIRAKLEGGENEAK